MNGSAVDRIVRIVAHKRAPRMKGQKMVGKASRRVCGWSEGAVRLLPSSLLVLSPPAIGRRLVSVVPPTHPKAVT